MSNPSINPGNMNPTELRHWLERKAQSLGGVDDPVFVTSLTDSLQKILTAITAAQKVLEEKSRGLSDSESLQLGNHASWAEEDKNLVSEFRTALSAAHQSLAGVIQRAQNLSEKRMHHSLAADLYAELLALEGVSSFQSQRL